MNLFEVLKSSRFNVFHMVSISAFILQVSASSHVVSSPEMSTFASSTPPPTSLLSRYIWPIPSHKLIYKIPTQVSAYSVCQSTQPQWCGVNRNFTLPANSYIQIQANVLPSIIQPGLTKAQVSQIILNQSHLQTANYRQNENLSERGILAEIIATGEDEDLRKVDGPRESRGLHPKEIFIDRAHLKNLEPILETTESADSERIEVDKSLTNDNDPSENVSPEVAEVKPPSPEMEASASCKECERASPQSQIAELADNASAIQRALTSPSRPEWKIKYAQNSKVQKAIQYALAHEIPKSTGHCFAAVKKALLAGGMVSDYLPGGSAYQGVSILQQRGFINLMDPMTNEIQGPFERILNEKDAPIGSIFVYETVPRGGNGDITIKTPKGNIAEILFTGAGSPKDRKLIGIMVDPRLAK